MDPLITYKEDIGKFNNIDLIEDKISIRKDNDRIVEYAIEDQLAMNQILDQVVNLSNTGKRYRTIQSTKILPKALKALKYERNEIKILINRIKDTAEGISSTSHFQISHRDIEPIYNQVIEDFSAKAHFMPNSIVLELEIENQNDFLPVDLNHLFKWNFGGNIPKPGSGMKFNFGFSVYQCSNWGIFYDITGSLFASEQLRLTGRNIGNINNFRKILPKKGLKERFLEKLPEKLYKSIYDLKHNTFTQIKTMRDISFDSSEAEVLLGNYVFKNKISQYDAELIYEKWETETDHNSLWDLHQALTYTYTHVRQKTVYQQISTDLYLHAELLHNSKFKKLIISNLSHILSKYQKKEMMRRIEYANY